MFGKTQLFLEEILAIITNDITNYTRKIITNYITNSVN
ncbi:hypothetical protein GARC_4504 [Paraglaciecola arctica BSs20135]|uniref:Uncharacterized protein n=1 Tax=Paraglaciecola arctica BSs20135 TaxID=493475 RepID=K6YBX4_9ALTE|nr:hypothetical protein GARC_4504 [Paraglaciecola arctica BSs20135]